MAPKSVLSPEQKAAKKAQRDAERLAHQARREARELQFPCAHLPDSKWRIYLKSGESSHLYLGRQADYLDLDAHPDDRIALNDLRFLAEFIHALVIRFNAGVDEINETVAATELHKFETSSRSVRET